jgi:hypothetical protein
LEEDQVRIRRWSLIVLLAAVPLGGGCGADKSLACEPCSNTEDCEAGLTCQLFEDSAGNTRNLCGDASPNMVCPSR